MQGELILLDKIRVDTGIQACCSAGQHSRSATCTQLHRGCLSWQCSGMAQMRALLFTSVLTSGIADSMGAVERAAAAALGLQQPGAPVLASQLMHAALLATPSDLIP